MPSLISTRVEVEDQNLVGKKRWDSYKFKSSKQNHWARIPTSNLNSTHYSHLSCHPFYPYLPQRFSESPNPIFLSLFLFSKFPLCFSELGFFQFRIFRWNLTGLANSRYRCCRLRKPPPPPLGPSRFNWATSSVLRAWIPSRPLSGALTAWKAPPFRRLMAAPPSSLTPSWLL